MSKMLLDVKIIGLGKGYFAFYIINDFNFESLVSKTEEFNRLNENLHIDLNYEEYVDFYREDVEKFERYRFNICKLENSDSIGVLSSYDFNNFNKYLNFVNGKELENNEDIINKPNHYQLNVKGNNIQVIDIIDEVVKDYKPQEAFKIANVIKYILRASKKNGKQDLKKAKKYIEMLLDE